MATILEGTPSNYSVFDLLLFQGGVIAGGMFDTLILYTCSNVVMIVCGTKLLKFGSLVDAPARGLSANLYV